MICNKRRALFVLVAVVLWAGLSSAQASISAAEAKNHIGERQTVCGQAVSVHYAAQSRGNPTFINLDKPYPNQVFTVLIWGSDRPKFGDPDAMYQNRQLCVTGIITDYKGVPEIVAREPSQVKIP